MTALVARLGRPTLAAALLLVLTQWSVVLAFWTIRGLDGQLIFEIAIFGLVIGWLFGAARVPWPIAFPTGVALGSEFLLIQIGQLGERVIALAGSIPEFVRYFLSRLAYGPFVVGPRGITLRPAQEFVDPETLRQAGAIWDAALVMLDRAGRWVSGIAAGRPHFDPVASALVWGMVILLLALWAAWMIRATSRAFEAMLPMTIVSSVLLVYTGGTGWSLVPLLFALLLLMPLIGHGDRERRWERTGVQYSEELRFDLTLVMVPLIVVIVAVASLAPSLSPGDIARSVEQALRDRPAETALTDSFGIRPAPRPTTVFDSLAAIGLPRQHLIGLKPEESNQVVMTIQVDPGPDSSAPERARYYWRSVTYDRYSGSGWYTSGVLPVDLAAGAPAIDEKGFATRRVVQRVHSVQADGLIYTAGQLISVDAFVRVARRTPEDVFSASIDKSDYVAQSFLVAPTDRELESSGTSYSDWVERNYLDIPLSVPARVLALARDLTATGKTPYDRAIAIETYLRQIPYSLEVPLPPPGRDAADYFLFDLRRGYCDYYATAMVVLARASGLPARLVVGYAAGSQDSQGTYVVRLKDAHSWPEIYFPDYGWVEFEPTAGRAAIDRAGQVGPSPKPPASQAPAGALNGQGQGNSPLILSLGVLLLALASLAGWYVIDEWRLSRFAAEPGVGEMYRRVVKSATRLGVAGYSSDTPYQLASRLSARLKELEPPGASAHPRTVARREQDRKCVAEIVDAYVRSRFSPRGVNAADFNKTLRNWRKLRWSLVRARIRSLSRSLASFRPHSLALGREAGPTILNNRE